MQNIKTHKIKLIAIVTLIIAVYLVVVWANSDNSGVIETPIAALPQTTVTVAYKDYAGSSVTFRYSGIYTLHTKAVSKNSGTYEQAMLKADTTYEKHISYEVDDLPGGSLANNSANNLRLNSPDVYAARNFEINGIPTTVWMKKDGTEQTALLPHGNRVAIISFVQIGTQSDLTPEVNAVLSTLKWKG